MPFLFVSTLQQTGFSWICILLDIFKELKYLRSPVQSWFLEPDIENWTRFLDSFK